MDNSQDSQDLPSDRLESGSVDSKILGINVNLKRNPLVSCIRKGYVRIRTPKLKFPMAAAGGGGA